jgi:CBS domain-containing protein
MSSGRICVRSVLVVAPDDNIRHAARLMAEQDVGTAVVLGPNQQPLGIITDRDIALRCVAVERDPDSTPVSDVMTTPMICVHESTPIESALSRMASVRVRRLAVVDDEDRLVGILALDDVLELLVEEAETIGRLLAKRPGLRGG